MRIGVISDSHGKVNMVKQAILEMGNIDALLHAGDSEQDFNPEEYPFPVYVVRGNCDDDFSLKEEQVISLADRKILLTHGHHYDYTKKISKLKAAAQREGADVVVFGHTHVPFNQVEDGILFLNPGSLAKPRVTKTKSYAVLTVDSGNISAEIFPLTC